MKHSFHFNDALRAIDVIRLRNWTKRKEEAVAALLECRATRDRYSDALSKIASKHDCSIRYHLTAAIGGKEVTHEQLNLLHLQTITQVNEANARYESVGSKVERLKAKISCKAQRTELMESF